MRRAFVSAFSLLCLHLQTSFERIKYLSFCGYAAVAWMNDRKETHWSTIIKSAGSNMAFLAFFPPQMKDSNPVPVLAASSFHQQHGDKVINQLCTNIFGYSLTVWHTCFLNMWKDWLGQFLPLLCNWAVKQTHALWSHWSFSWRFECSTPMGMSFTECLNTKCIICEADIMMAASSWCLYWQSNGVQPIT